MIPVFDPLDRTSARLVQAERIHRLEVRARDREQLAAAAPDPLRRRVGLRLMRLGARLAFDQPFEPARSR
ncbi:MAG TPA: hypothetical protein VF763_08375 [Candidatus Limnocylindrales bacterium]